jgi:F-type H+-transporting ATPase subunit delta
VTSRAAAIRYARALFDVASKEQLDLQRVDRELTEFVTLVKGDPALSRVMSNPAVPAPRKKAIVQSLLALSPLMPPVARLLVMLAERDRLGLLDELAGAFRERMREYQQVVRAEVTTAFELPGDRVAALRAGIARATGREVHLETRVDPAIIGGVITRIGSTVYDGSVTTQLQKLKQQLVRAET